MTDLPEVSSGRYEYRLNGEPTAIRETWTREKLADSLQRWSSTRHAPGVELSVQASVRDGGLCTFEVCWQATGAGAIRAHYALTDDYLRYQRWQAGVPSAIEEIPLPREGVCVLSPLMRIFTGPVIARLLQAGGEGTVIVPAIGEPENTAALLRPQISQRQARVLQAQAQLELETVSRACRVCEYQGDQYAAGTQFWLDEDDRLLRYTWQQSPAQFWDVRLKP